MNLDNIRRRVMQLEQQLEQATPQLLAPASGLASFPHAEYQRLFAARVDEIGIAAVLEAIQHHLTATLAEYSGGGAA